MCYTDITHVTPILNHTIGSKVMPVKSCESQMVLFCLVVEFYWAGSVFNGATPSRLFVTSINLYPHSQSKC